MSAPPFRKAKALFLRALELPPEELEAFLDARCEGAPELRSLVEELLTHHRQGRGDVLEPTTTTPDPPDHLPDIESYRILEQIGEGGMGTVYHAMQLQPVRREVAIKILKAGLDTKSVLARFAAERQALAIMDHPNIAKVFDAGETSAGRSYFVMELVRGETLTQHCDRHRLSMSDRLRLFILVCRAVQHAHQKGIIHRDLKPSNILVSMSDGTPIPKIIDFGIAKATGRSLADESVYTALGQFLGTPEYMSPEQAGGELDIDTRSDVYSLGIVLYELLTGTLPFSPESLRRASLAEVQRIIREETPPKPSTRVETGGPESEARASRRSTDAPRLTRDIRGELDWIVLRAIEKQPQRRYETPTALAADVERHLNDEPVSAQPPSRTYLLRKTLRRHRMAFSFVAILVVVLLASTVTMSLLFGAQQRESERARREATKAERISTFLQDMLSSIEPDKAHGQEVTVREVLDLSASKVGDELGGEPEVLAAIRTTIARTYGTLFHFEEAEDQYRAAYLTLHARHGADHPAALEARRRLARSLSSHGADGKHGEAEREMQEVIESDRRVLGSDDPQVADDLMFLSSVQMGREDLTGAESSVREAWRIRRILGEEYAEEVVECIWRLGDIRAQAGDLDSARVCFEMVLETYRKHHPDDPDLADVHVALANLADRGGDPETAEIHGKETLRILREEYGGEHRSVAVALKNLGTYTNRQGKLDDAERYYRLTLEMWQRLLGEDHPQLASVLADLAHVLVQRDELEQAEGLLLRSIALYETAGGPGHPRKAWPLALLGSVYTKQGDLVQAEGAYRDGLDFVEQVVPPRHWMIGAAKSLLGRCLAGQRRFDEAERLLLAGEEVLADAPAGVPMDSYRADCLDFLADLYDDWGRPADATRFRERRAALEHSRQNGGGGP